MLKCAEASGSDDPPRCARGPMPGAFGAAARVCAGGKLGEFRFPSPWDG